MIAAQPGALARAWARAGAAIYDPFLALGERRGMRDRRAALLAGARGRVLEIGAGTGLNLPFYPPELDALVLSEPQEGMARRLQSRRDRERPDARVVRASADALPFADASFDAVVSTLVLCTVPDPEAAVAEVAACCVPAVACSTSSTSAATVRWAAGRTASHPRGPRSRQVVAAIGGPTTCSTAPSRWSPGSARSGAACPASSGRS